MRIVIPARDLKKAAGVKEAIQKESPNAEIIIFETDMSSFVSVKRFCSGFLALGLPLNILMWVYIYIYISINSWSLVFFWPAMFSWTRTKSWRIAAKSMITLIAEIMLEYTLRNWSSLKTKSKWHLLRITWVNTESLTGSSSSFRNYDIAGIFLLKKKNISKLIWQSQVLWGKSWESKIKMGKIMITLK